MWLMFYGGLTVIMLLLAWASGQHVPQKLALLMLASWSTSNLAVSLLGFDGASYVTPAIDAALAVPTAALALNNRSWGAFWTLIMFLLQIAAHGVAFMANGQASYLLYLSLNLLFLAQVVMIGGISATLAVRRFAPVPRQRSHYMARN